MWKSRSLTTIETPYPNIPPLRLSPDEQLRTGAVAAQVHISSKPGVAATSIAAYPVRHMSPKALAELAYDLYMEGELERDEYMLLGFPSEVHPSYNQTVGALTGEPAQPNTPRDLIREWEDHLRQISKSRLPLRVMRDRARKILSLLRWLESPSLGKSFAST